MDESADIFRRMRAGDGPWWRWHRALDLIEQESRPDEWDDPPTIAAWEFCKHLAAPAATPSKEAKDSPLSQAHAIYFENGPRRWEIESRLLSGGGAEISRRLGIGTDVVEAYAATFFDVLGRLDARGWLRAHLPIGIYTPANPTEGELWMHVAATGGGAGPALDMLIGDYLSLPEPAVHDRHALAEDIRTLIRFGCTPPRPTRAYRALLRRMWKLSSNRISIRDSVEWRNTILQLEAMEVAAGFARAAPTEECAGPPAQAVGQQEDEVPPITPPAATEITPSQPADEPDVVGGESISIVHLLARMAESAASGNPSCAPADGDAMSADNEIDAYDALHLQFQRLYCTI